VLDSIGRFSTIEWVQATGSTNADLVERVRQGLRAPTARFTDLQTAGRGRRDRRWDMESGGGIMVSFFVPWTDPHTMHCVPTMFGLAAVEAIEEHDRHVGLKWPNDLVTTNGEKLGGMLSEVVSDGAAVVGIVSGLGCNVSWHPPAHDGRSSTSLDALGGTPIDREALGTTLCQRFSNELDRFGAEGPKRLAERFRKRCHTIGQLVRVEQTDGTLEGTATDVDDEGRLVVEVDGHLRTVSVGDVIHLRPRVA
jgi:BirA family biotin operon repressor/biotin-[acetyl-CoA-carboxylase] ligase